MAEDIPEDKIPAYIAETKLNRDDLKSGQKAALVIRLYYEEERRKAKERELSGIRNPDPNSEQGRTNEILAKKAGIGKSSMANLLAVYRNRLDLFERVFNGEISINKAYTQMKVDEAPEEVPQENPVEFERKLIEEGKENFPTLDVFGETMEILGKKAGVTGRYSNVGNP